MNSDSLSKTFCNVWTGMFIDVLWYEKVVWLRGGENIVVWILERKKKENVFLLNKINFVLARQVFIFRKLFFLIKIIRRVFSASKKRIFYDALVDLTLLVSSLSQQSYRPALTFIAVFFLFSPRAKAPQFADNSIFLSFRLLLPAKGKKNREIFITMVSLPDGDNKTNKSFWITSIKLYGFPVDFIEMKSTVSYYGMLEKSSCCRLLNAKYLALLSGIYTLVSWFIA